MNLRRYFFTLLVVLPLSSPLSAQETEEDDKFYLDFAGSAVFPYNPKGQLGHGVKAGAGLTAAFGYAFKEGFSTEIEWGHQKVGIGNPTGNLSQVTWQSRKPTSERTTKNRKVPSGASGGRCAGSSSRSSN